MKRFLALAALVLGMVSCQTEPEGLDVNVGGEQDVNITVSLPEGTRADSALGAFENVDMTQYDIRYIFQVFDAKGENAKEMQVVYTDEQQASFNVRLIANRNYTFVVWADLVKNGEKVNAHYTIGTTLKEITLNEWAPMDETRDAFTCSEVCEFKRNANIRLQLKRPFAKLRVITTDMEELMGVEPTTVEVEYTTPHYEGFNAVSQMPTSKQMANKTHEATAIFDYEETGANKTLFTDYFFAKAEQGEIVNFSMTVRDQNGEVIDVQKDFNTPIPVQRNYVTTIKGNILTYADDFNVVINPAFDGYYAVPSEVSELVNVINSAADGVETIIPVNENIELPESLKALTIPAGKNIVLDFAANTTLTGALVVEDGAELTVNNGTIVNTDKSVSGITTNGDLTLNNVEIKSARHAVRVESGEVVIYGGTFEVDPVSASTLHALNVGDDGKSANVTIKGGTFIGPKGTMADSGSAVNVRNGSKVTIEGGNFSGGKSKTLSAAANDLDVQGGFFDQDPSNFLADGYLPIKINDTLYAVMKGSVENGVNTYVVENSFDFDQFSSIVIKGYTFSGQTVKLTEDVDFTGKTVKPVGFTGGTPKVFEGTFDGNGKTIKNINQQNLSGSYNQPVGLFSKVNNATFKNINLESFSMATYGSEAGGIATWATGDCTFEDITIKNGSVVAYNCETGGVLGWAESGNFTFKDITIAKDVTIHSLWDSHDTPVGGLIGGVGNSSSSGYTMSVNIENVTIACKLDVYNDVGANYQWGAYRRAGMIIGNIRETKNIDGTAYPNPVAENVTCSNVTVTYGDWMNYHYCEFKSNGHGSYDDEYTWKCTRVEASDWGSDGIDTDNCTHESFESHNMCLPFDQLFGGGQGVYGLREYEGVTVNYPASYRREVSTTAQLTEALSNGLSVVLDADIDFGSTQLAITGENQVVDLGGHALTTANNWGGISLKNGATIKNGTITHAGNTAAIKAFNGSSVENVTINATCTTADKTVTGIAVQQGANVESIKNVTINGVSQGIEVGYQATVGLIENAVVNESNNGTAKGIGLVINGGKVGLAKNCTFEGETYGITMHLKGVFAVGLELQNCVVEGATAAIYAWDEKGISNTSGSLNLTYDAATTLNGELVWDFEDECKDVVTLHANRL